MEQQLTHGSLFAGIGGIDLGFERVGIKTIWQVEIDPFCRAVLARHWPDVPQYDDIHGVDFTSVERPDIISGGFPCQPFSDAGKRKGLDDERWLWPQFARAVRDIRPRFVVVENVRGILGRGFGAVLGDLAALGYDAEWDLLPAEAFGAPHLRERVFLVGYADGVGLAGVDRRGAAGAEPTGGCSGVPDADRERQRTVEREVSPGQPDAAGSRAEASDAGRERREGGLPVFDDAFAERVAAVARRDTWWAAEPDVGRVAYGVPRRVDRLRALGNAVVPQVAEFIGRILVECQPT